MRHCVYFNDQGLESGETVLNTSFGLSVRWRVELAGREPYEVEERRSAPMWLTFEIDGRRVVFEHVYGSRHAERYKLGTRVDVCVDRDKSDAICPGRYPGGGGGGVDGVAGWARKNAYMAAVASGPLGSA